MQSDSSLRTAIVKSVLLAAFLLPGCASYNGAGLVAGTSRAGDVEALMGPPTEKIAAANGDSVWFYPRSPAGLHTYAVRISPDGVMREFSQRLTEDNLKYLVAGQTTTKETRELFGPPWRIIRFERQQRDVWDYRMYNSVQVEYILSVQFSGDGLVREVLFMRDQRYERDGRNSWSN